MIILFTGCYKQKENSKNSNFHTIVKESFEFKTLENESYFNDDIIMDEVTAKKYADLVFVNTLKKDLNNYKACNTTFYEANKIWVITYGINYETVGGDISIVLSAETGEILKISFGE